MNIRFPKQFITRHIEADFVDDGNHFKGYLYKDMIPITYLRDGDEIYCTIRIDYMIRDYDDYAEVDAIAHQFNGVSVYDFNMKEFLQNCEIIYQFGMDYAKPENIEARINKKLQALEKRKEEIELELFKQKLALKDLKEA